MTKFLISLFILITLTWPVYSQTVPAVDCALMVHQLDAGGERVLLFSDTTTFLKGMPASGFLTGFSIEVEMIEIDTIGCEFRVHAVTLGPPTYNYSQHYRVEYSLPARLDGIMGKPGVEYSLSIQPLVQREVDTTGCGINHREKGAFKFSPSGYMDIYYAERTFGEFYWTLIKGIFEDRYRFFRAMNNFNLPGKYLIYLCPCPLYSVIWDDRFGMMVDPTRNTVFAVYNKDFNSADPFLVLQASVFKNYGYAPAFLSEGLAGFLSLAEYQMKQIVARNQNVPLDSLLDTHAYLSLEPVIADRSAASLAKYLINQYNSDMYLTMYSKANDLNLREVMTDVYGKSIDELEGEWLEYIDTVSISRRDLSQQADIAEAMFDYSRMKEYSLKLLEISLTRDDTLAVLPGLVRASFSSGNYYESTEYQSILTSFQPDYFGNWLALSAYQMMNGMYDESAASLARARALDSTTLLVDFNLAMHALNTGETERGWQMLAGIILGTAAGGPQGEARALYGNYLSQSDSEDDKALALQYCSEAINSFSQSIQMGNVSPDAYLWSGIAYLGMGDTGNAWDHLWLARFIDLRPFYEGLANLWLGKVADVMGDHETAQEFYGMVISGAAADYHQTEARRLIKEPYQP